MIRSARYVRKNNIIADEINSTTKYCKEAQVGVDLSVRNIWCFNNPGVVNKDKTHVSDYSEIPTIHYDDGNKVDNNWNGWFLKPGATYICELNEGVQLGKNDTGIIIMRSSLNRCGVSIESALWDPGFTTHNTEDGKSVIKTMNVRLTVMNPWGFWLEKNSRVAQLIISDNEDVASLYNGQYQGGEIQSRLITGK
jgi:dUTP pyrophosphatase